MEQKVEKSKFNAVIAFAFSLAFWIPLLNYIFCPLATFFGIKALLEIKRHPDKFAGLGYAITAIIIGITSIAFFLIGVGICGYEIYSNLNRTTCSSMGLTFLT